MTILKKSILVSALLVAACCLNGCQNSGPGIPPKEGEGYVSYFYQTQREGVGDARDLFFATQEWKDNGEGGCNYVFYDGEGTIVKVYGRQFYTNDGQGGIGYNVDYVEIQGLSGAPSKITKGIHMEEYYFYDRGACLMFNLSASEEKDGYSLRVGVQFKGPFYESDWLL